jgi:UDP-N-acetylglucosamine 2-epimerase (hydrolysing)
MSNKKIVFLTGTRADFGKIKSLITALEKDDKYTPYVFVTGMHLMEDYGYTLLEVEKSGFEHVDTFENHTHETTMDLTLAKTIDGFSNYIKKTNPDLIVVHGDRVEALAGAIVGSLNNILVAHIEGGEVSGTIDELIRHSVSKMSHLHYVANDLAKKRLIQMGEVATNIFIIGSPDIDVMFSNDLPSINEVTAYYEIPYDHYAVLMYHPVTTDNANVAIYANNLVDALLKDDKNYVVIYPNNDLGSREILKAYKRLNHNSRFRVFPSIRFEYFLSLLKHSDFIIGNSSAGIREAPYYGVPTLNIGTRQKNRALHKHILHSNYETNEIYNAISKVDKIKLQKIKPVFGHGNSATLFIDSLRFLWSNNSNIQKQFIDLK